MTTQEIPTMFYDDLPSKYFFWKKCDNPNVVLELYSSNVVDNSRFSGLKLLLKEYEDEDARFVVEGNIACYAVDLLDDTKKVYMRDYDVYKDRNNRRTSFIVETQDDVDTLERYFSVGEMSLDMTLVSKTLGSLTITPEDGVISHSSLYNDKCLYVFNTALVTDVSLVKTSLACSLTTVRSLAQDDQHRSQRVYDLKGSKRVCVISRNKCEDLLSCFVKYHKPLRRYYKTKNMLYEVVLNETKLLTVDKLSSYNLSPDKSRWQLNHTMLIIQGDKDIQTLTKLLDIKINLTVYWKKAITEEQVAYFFNKWLYGVFGGVEGKGFGVVWNINLIKRFDEFDEEQ